MQLVRDDNIHNFLQRNLAFLEEKEAANNLLLGIAFALSKKENGHFPVMLLTVEEEGRPVFCCLQTIPKNLIVYGSDEHLREAIGYLLDHLESADIQLPGIIGPRSIASELAGRWAAHFQQPWRISMEQLIYRLDAVNDLELAPGVFRAATEKDADTVIPWFEDFLREALGETANGEGERVARQKIQANELYLWEHEKVVSMAATTRPSRHGITVNFVYTPEEERRQGYATSCVSRLSELMLNSGYSFCSLFTDLKNPTSNNIYRRIGYRVVEEFQQIEFG